MLVCRRSKNGTERRPGQVAESAHGNGDRRSGLGAGGPVFLPRRKLSALARALLADLHLSDRVEETETFGPPAT